MSARPAFLSPLQHQSFREIWLANLGSSLGGLIQSVGAAWTMTAITASVDLVALVQASTTLPIMLFSLLGGAIADSFNRRRVMMGAQAFMLLTSLLLALCTYLGLITPWLLLSFTFLIGCGNALNNPSWQASVGDVVPRTEVPAAVALNSIGFNLSRSVGPAIGGLIVAAAGAAAAFATNALSYAPLLFVLFRWKPSYPQSPLPRESMGAAIMSGLRYVAMSPDIGRVLLRSFVFGFAAVSILALLPVVASTRLGGGALVYGILLGAFGMGAVGGAILSGNARRRLSAEAIVRLAFLGFSFCALVLGLSQNPWPAGLALLAGGACWVLALSLFNVTVQISTPRWVVGRALSIYQTAVFGGMAVGSWCWGVLGELYGVQWALLASAGLLLVGAGLGFLVPLPRQEALNLDPLNRWKEPHLELELEPRSGPIVISIEYRIRRENTPEFLEVMADRKRVRRRDGARHWTLTRDLEDPELWVETFQTPTWTEYVRHNLRTTQADAAISDKLRNLHAGTGRPVVHRRIERPPAWFANRARTEVKSTIDPH